MSTVAKVSGVGGAPQIGDRMPDGTVYAGVSPETGKPMYATPNDAPLTYTFNQAKDYAAALDAHGHKDWRAPTKSELSVLIQSAAAIGNFDIPISNPAGWYWSSSETYNHHDAWAQRLKDGLQYSGNKNDSAASLRCVRG